MFVDDPTRIQHMIDSAEEAISFTQGKSQSDLDADRLLSLGLLKCVETVGEAAFKVSRNFQIAHPEIDWQALITMRHSLVHDYFAIDLEAVWNTVQVDLPALLPKLRSLVP